MSFLKEYTLLGELGTGGFAKVYKVRHNELGYIRAIRVLNEPITDENSRTYQKFLRECKVLLRLGNGSQSNIVHIYQPRLLENHALVEMDYVDGKDIAHYLQDNGNFLPIDEVLRMAKEMSGALAYCHEDIYKFCMDPDEDNLESDPIDGSKWFVDDATKKRLIEKYKIIHNDIHSGNIMRREDGSFVLLDFGLAITGGDDVRNSSRHENGAVEYKAPEKWDDDTALTEQSDIYSFGIVLYEYLVGRVPFPYDKTNSNRIKAAFMLGEAHKNQTPPPIFELRKAYYEAKNAGKTYEKDYPDWLEEAIMKCLEKDPSRRFRNGKELYEFICKHDDGQNTSLVSENQSLTEEIRQLEQEKKKAEDQLEQEKKKAEERISRLYNENQSLQECVNTITAEKQKLESQNNERPKTEVQTIVETTSQKKKSSIVPWIVAAAACLALLAVLLFPKNDRQTSEPVEYPVAEFVEEVNMASTIEALKKEYSHWDELTDEAKAELNMKAVSVIDSFSEQMNAEMTEEQKAEMEYLRTEMKEVSFANLTVDEQKDLIVTFLDEGKSPNINTEATVLAESAYLLSGQTYHAKAMLTQKKNLATKAYVRFDGGAEKEYISDNEGVIKLDYNVGVGSHMYQGYIQTLNPITNKMEEYPFEKTFVVAPPAVSVSAKKMNVVYRGVNNPIAVGGGVGGEISASASSGSLTRTGNGTYNLLPGAADEVTISVSSGGSSLGSMKFRVKDLPKPTALIRNVVNGQVSKSALLAANRVEAEIKDFDFDGVHYDVVGYTFRYKTKAGTSKEAKASCGAFTDEIKNAISAANVGDVFVFTAIQVRGNDGKTKTLETPIGVEIK